MAFGAGFYRASTRQLTKTSFVLAHNQSRRYLWLGACSGLATAALAIAGFYFFAPEAESVRELASTRAALERLTRHYDERELELRMTGARTTELERQIEILNQRIRELQDELAFYRKAQETRK